MGDALQIMLGEGKRLLSADIDFFSVYVLFESIIYFNVIFIYSFSFLCECVEQSNNVIATLLQRYMVYKTGYMDVYKIYDYVNMTNAI